MPENDDPGGKIRDALSRVEDASEFLREFSKEKALHDAELAGKFDARNVYYYIAERVTRFQDGLPLDHEVGLVLANAGVASEIHIRSISFRDPNLIEFSGMRGEHEVCLVQHISQLNFLLVAVPPIKDEEPFRIGFPR